MPASCPLPGDASRHHVLVTALGAGTLVMMASGCAGGSSSAAGSAPATSPASSVSSSVSSSVASSDTSSPATPVAGRLQAVAGCAGKAPADHVADLSWQPASPRGEAQRVLLTYREDGWPVHDFLTSTELAPGRTTYRWTGLEPGTDARYWRVITMRDGQWSGSETGTFNGMACPGDPSDSG
jgi:hypothetical protein